MYCLETNAERGKHEPVNNEAAQCVNTIAASSKITLEGGQNA